MTQQTLISIVNRLIDFIINDSVNNHFGLAATHYFYPEKKIWKPQLAEFDDVGDFTVFVAWAGKILNNQKYLDWADQQFELWEKYGRLANGWYRTHINCDDALPKDPTVISLYDYQDAVLGFYGMFQLTKQKKYQERLLSLLSRLSYVAKKHGSRIPNQIFFPLHMAVPWTSHSPAVAGIIAEHAILFGKKENHEKLKLFGKNLINAQFETVSWQKNHLFHQGYNLFFPRLSPYKRGKIMKENSNMVFAMVMHPEFAPQIKQFAKNLLHLQSDSGGFWAEWNIARQSLDKRFITKTQNFTIIDVLLAMYLYSDENRYLHAAVKCGNFWLQYKSQETDLIPDYVSPKGDAVYPVAKLDQSADLYSSFLRLYSITGDKTYLDEALVGATAMAKTFGQDEWWHRIVNIQTGNPAKDEEVPPEDRPTSRNLTKYVGGALRFYLSLYEVLQGKHMYNDDILWLMSRDR